MQAIEDLLDDLLPGAPLRVVECDFPFYSDRGYEVEVRRADRWIAVAGWARYADRIVAALGLDPVRQAAVGVGLGLERIAALRHGIDDIRSVELERVDDRGRVARE
jgi:phenylalanyl-tRNA synthetase alpha subunit